MGGGQRFLLNLINEVVKISGKGGGIRISKYLLILVVNENETWVFNTDAQLILMLTIWYSV